MTLSITIPFVPHSLKNGVRLGGGRMRRSSQVVRDQQAMSVLLTQAARAAGHKGTLPLWPDDEVEVTITRDVHADTCVVTFTRLGPRPRGRTGRDKDTQNLLDAVCDAAEGIVYANDNQVGCVFARRVTKAPEGAGSPETHRVG